MRFSVIAFARNATVLLENKKASDNWPVSWPAIAEDDASNLDLAMAWRAGEEDRRPRWVFTDGLLEMSPMAAAKIDLALTIKPPAATDVGIVNLRFESEMTSLRADVAATGNAQAIVEFLRAGEVFHSQTIALASNTQSVTAPIDPKAGGIKYEVRVRPAAGAPAPARHYWPENNSASILSPPAGPPKVLYVSQRKISAGGLPKEFSAIEPGQFPANLAEMAPYQVVMLDDLPAAALRPDTPPLLDRFVRDTAGGVIFLGRQYAFGPGGYIGTTLDGLSPLASAPPKRPPSRIIFVLDASASMGDGAGGSGGQRKFNFVAEGVASAMESLRENDRVAAVSFGTRATLLGNGSRGEIAAKLNETLRNLPTGGPTLPDTTLDLFRDMLDEETHLILLTDGEIENMDLARWARIIDSVRGQLTVVAPEPKAGSTLRKLIDQTRGKLFPTDDPTQWPKLLKQAVESPVIGRARSDSVRWIELPNESNVGGSTSNWIETWPKSDARVLASSPVVADKGSAIAAIARRGLGSAAGVSFDSADENFSKLLTRIVKETAPPPGDRRFAASAFREAGKWKLQVVGSEEKTFLNDFRIQVDLISPDTRTPRTVELPQVAPGEYAVTIADAPAAFSAVITYLKAPNEPQLIAHLAPPALAGAEYPAGAVSGGVPQGVVRIDADSILRTQWNPRIRGERRAISGVCYFAAALALVATLWLRRTHR
jgi:hypothetical protein